MRRTTLVIAMALGMWAAALWQAGAFAGTPAKPVQIDYGKTHGGHIYKQRSYPSGLKVTRYWKDGIFIGGAVRSPTGHITVVGPRYTIHNNPRPNVSGDRVLIDKRARVKRTFRAQEDGTVRRFLERWTPPQPQRRK